MSLSTDEPPVLPIGTDVSAKYKGAFCEAKIKKIARNVKCKLTVKQTNSAITVDDESITGVLRVGSHISAKHNDKIVEAVINKILDQSYYTVVFDDGDEATLKRTSLCLKSGKHFAESETLDQLPLTNPEHFGNPVSLGRRRRRRHHNSDSEDDEVEETETHSQIEKDPDWGRVVCADYGDKRGSKKDIWFPALIVAPTAHDRTTKINKDEYLVRSFRDGRFYKVNKKDVREFTKEMVLSKSERNSSALTSAMEKAFAFIDKQELPHSWDYDLLMGNVIPQMEEEIETSEEFDSAMDESDDEQSEEKDRFVAQLYKYMDERGTPINRAPSVGGRDLNLYKLYRIVVKMGGYNRVTNKNSWRAVYTKLGLPVSNTAGKDSSIVQLKTAYKKFLHSFDDFYRKLGCTITVNSRTSRPSRGERLREDRTSVKKSLKKDKDKEKEIKKEDIVVDKEKDKDKEVKESTSGTTTTSNKSKDKDKDKDKHKDKVKEEIKVEIKEEVKDKVEEKPIVKEVKEEIKVKTDETQIEEKKRGRGRKKREEVVDEPPVDEDTMTGISTIDESEEEDNKSVKNSKLDESLIKTGDSLKVKYGRGRQLKVYEAKVLKIEVDPTTNKRKYFVHYSGWNSRYDEWIKKSRIDHILCDRSPKRRSGKHKNKGEPVLELSLTPPNSGTNNINPFPTVTPPVNASQSSSSAISNDSVETSKPSPQPPKRGRPPNSKNSVSKEQSSPQPTQQSQSQPSPQPSQSSSVSVRRGRPPTLKKEKFTRSKSVTDDQSTNDSFANSSICDEITAKSIEEKKTEPILSSDNEISDKTDRNDTKDGTIGSDEPIASKGVQPPELIDESTVENKTVEEEVIENKSIETDVKIENTIDESNRSIDNKNIDSETDESVSHLNESKDEINIKCEEEMPVKDAFDFDEEEEELVKTEEPLKEQLKKKRKAKDEKKSKNSDKSKDRDNNEDKDKSSGITRKNSKKTRKSVIETIEKVIEEVMPKVFEELPKVLVNKEEEEKKSKSSVSSNEPKQETKKRKGRKRKDDESVSPVKKKVKPSKLEITVPEEDSNLEVQKLFEHINNPSIPVQEDISPVEEIKVLPQFTNDINPTQQESVSSDFLLCEEAVPASPEKVTLPEEHTEDSIIHESPQSFHSSPTQSPQEVINKEPKGSGSNSELENEPIVMKDDVISKMETIPSPVHDEDSIISRPDLSKSPISPKKRRRGRIRTASQSDSGHKERIGCKTRGSSGRHRAERHSPLTALEHRSPFSLTQISFHNYIPESKYNFCSPIDESLDPDRRINILQDRISELRKTYVHIKSEVAILDRKKKKARRKEREKSHKSGHNFHLNNSSDGFHNNSNYNINNSLNQKPISSSFTKEFIDSMNIQTNESFNSSVSNSINTSNNS